jgi:alkylation response protein AidB-like acyl-CoA dehydrogenase
VDLTYGERYEAFRAELREFLTGWPLRGAEAQLPREEQERIFRKRGIDAGYVYRTIPVRVRRRRTRQRSADRPRDPGGVSAHRRAGNRLDQGPGLLVPTLLEFGSEEQKRRFIPPTLAGEMKWCQGYSEPGSGSDLASLQTTARLDGDHWVINGQKIWTSNALHADYMFGLFRTEPEASKHAGISYLLVPMNAPGIDVRPLKQMTGSTEFNEVFFDDARAPAGNIVGKRGEGWSISRSTLKHERNLIGNPRLMVGQFEVLLQIARTARRDGRPAIEDSGVRRRIAEIEGYVRACETTNLRMLSASMRGEELSVMMPMMMIKLFSTEVMKQIACTAYDLLGSDGLLEPSAENDSIYDTSATLRGVVHNYMYSLGPAIAGGASNIQRNIIGERGLGLPRDLRPER